MCFHLEELLFSYTMSSAKNKRYLWFIDIAINDIPNAAITYANHLVYLRPWRKLVAYIIHKTPHKASSNSAETKLLIIQIAKPNNATAAVTLIKFIHGPAAGKIT